VSSSPPDITAASERRRLIFVSDASAEADRLATTLRRDGYSVVDVALSTLLSRVSVERPSLLLCDADDERCLDIVRGLRSLPEGTAVDVILVGSPGATLALDRDAVAAEATARFVRPVDIEALRSKVRSLLGPGGRAETTPRSHRPPVLASSSRPPSRRSSIPLTDDALLGEALDTLDNPEPASTPPALGTPSTPPSAHLELSGEIQTLLIEAERRVAGSSRSRTASERIDPDDNLEDHGDGSQSAEVLPGDVLEALEQPLDDDDDVFGAGGAESSPPATGPGHVGTGAGTRGHSAGHSEPPPESSDVGTSVEGVRSVGIDDSRRRQNASTPKPPRHTPASAPSEPPPRASERASPLSRTHTDLPDSHETTPPPPSAPTDPPASLRPRGTETAAIEMAPPESVPPQPPGTHGGDPSTAPPPGRSRREPSRDLAKRAATRDPSTAPPLPRGQSERLASQPVTLTIPETLRAGTSIRILAQAIVCRWSGSIAFEVDQGIRRVVFRGGDFVTAASGVHAESLVAFLVARGDLPRDIAREAHKLPPSGRHAGAALVARGNLAQDQLWEVIRAHAEWIIGQTVNIAAGSAVLETELPGRLKDEPSVFGGATGAEVLIDTLRRIVDPEVAAQSLGGWDVHLAPGAKAALMNECALATEEAELVAHPEGHTLRELVSQVGDLSFASAVQALVELGVLQVGINTREEAPDPDLERAIRSVDVHALRERIVSRRSLVEEGDYFALLGLPRSATGYDIRRAYTKLRRDLDPSRALTAGTADLEEDLDEILVVLDEAYEILRDQVRRERYRRAIEATP
jgi:hypothetical protein